MIEYPLKFIQVTKNFPYGKTQIQALRGLDLSLSAGHITGLLGPDGAGKSTLMRLATGLLLPDAGEVLVFGADSRKDAAKIQSEIGYMPQRFGLYEDLTVQQNLDLYADLQGLNQQESRERQQELLKLTGLGPFGARRARALSGGMKQKLGLACALLRAPRLLLLDEPTVGVDPISRRELWNIVQDIKKNGGTVLISTAYFDEAERCDEIILLHEGQLLSQQTPQNFSSPLKNKTYFVSDYHVSRRLLQDRLNKRAHVLDARIVAEGNRVLCSDTHPHPEAGEHWEKVTPSFEDAFVALLGSKKIAAVNNRQTNSRLREKPALASEVIIEIKNLSRFFGAFQAVKNISFNVRKGEIFGLLGANGAGKTTAFRMLCGLLPPSSGSLRVAGVDMRYAPAIARARIGYVSQKFSLYGNLSINQNLKFYSAAYGLRGKKQAERLGWALEEFQLSHYRDENADNLPLGIKQRLALSCALLHNPSILFLDEPTSGVDPLARQEFWQQINRLAENNVTVLITTHFMDEAEYCDNLVLMSLGEILAQGSPPEIRAQAQNDVHPKPSMEDAFIHLIQHHEVERTS
jgi:ABC-2 type transport system ATP-binding protein